MDVKDKVIEIIAEQAVLDVSDVTMDSTLESLGIDSLGLVESIFAIEEAFDIQVPLTPTIQAKAILIFHLWQRLSQVSKIWWLNSRETCCDHWGRDDQRTWSQCPTNA